MEYREIESKIISLITEEFYRPSEEEKKDINVSSEIIDEKGKRLLELEEKCKKCTKCSLYKEATNLVFSDGDYHSGIVFVGEAPGEEEDKQGKPFVGRAGKLLTSTLEEYGMKRSSVYICNVLKHRPPGNRDPLPDEIALCSPYLLEQLSIIQPSIVITLGNFSTKFLLNTNEGILRLRGKFRKSPLGYIIFPTFHPAAVLRNMNYLPDFKKDISIVVSFVNSGGKLP